MRLEAADQAPSGVAQAGGGERRAHLARVVRVVVDERHAADLAVQLEAPPRARELRGRLRGALEVDARAHRGRERAERVEHVVPAGHAQRERPKPHAFQRHVRIESAEVVRAQLLGAPLGVRGEAEALDARPGGAAGAADLVRRLGVRADEQQAVGPHALREGRESRAQPLLAAVVVEVVRLEVGDDRDLRLVLEERLGVLVGLDHGVHAAAVAGVAAEARRVAAEQHERVEAAVDGHLREQGGAGGLAVAARDGEHEPLGEQPLHHLRPREHLHAALARGLQLGVVAGGGGRGDDELGAAEVGGRVAVVDGAARALQTLAVVRAREVGAGHDVPAGEQDLPDGGEVDATRPDEVNPPGDRAAARPGVQQARHQAASPSSICASCSAASGRSSSRIACAMRSRAASFSISRMISPGSSATWSPESVRAAPCRSR